MTVVTTLDITDLTPTEYRAVLVMRDIEGFDYQQMADVLGLPLGTLKSRLFRARLALEQSGDDGARADPVLRREIDAFGRDAPAGCAASRCYPRPRPPRIRTRLRTLPGRPFGKGKRNRRCHSSRVRCASVRACCARVACSSASIFALSSSCWRERALRSSLRCRA